jgi:hypothetical protein
MITLESIQTNFIESYLQDCYFCMPAIVVGVQEIQQMKVDVKPLPKRKYKDSSVVEFPVLQSVPVVMPNTTTSSVSLPVNQGDTVLLVFCQREIDTFKSGATLPYEPETERWMDINDAVAIIGLNPFNRSPNLPSKRKYPYSPNHLTITHNVGGANESEIRFDAIGGIEVNAISVKLQANTIELITQ